MIGDDMALCPPINVLSLCSGVGGLELGIRLALPAARTICHVEREAAAAASLVASMEAGWFHPAPVWSDLLTFDARPWRGLVHILASGDPCQDNSVAGKRAGSDGERFLAPEVVRIADECRPDLIFRENVPGNAGEQLAALVPPLERLGYRVACGIFSSAETGNTMRRERLFVLAELARASLQRCGEAGRSGRRPAQRIGPAGATLERSESLRPGEGGTEHAREQGRRAAAGTGGELARPGKSGLSGQQRGQQRGQHHAAGRQVKSGHAGLCSGAVLPPAVIPGPTDSRWRDVLDRWPELQPALSAEEAQSHLRRGIDAMAHRIERLRATGNGVDPVAAAYAFIRLRALLAEAGAGSASVRSAA